MIRVFEGRGFSLPLGKKTYVMGILNVTPDSFSDGGKWFEVENAVSHALKMIEDGADILDIGAQSTRPGHTPVSPEEELRRLTPVLEALKGKIPVPISVDTYYPEVAREVLKMGAHIVNDVSGVFNTEMAEIVRDNNAGWIVMHTGGGTADINVQYPDGVTADVISFYEDMMNKAVEFGIKPSQMCMDPGIGFGKTYEENLELIRTVSETLRDDCALLVGSSRKRVIGQATGIEKADERTSGNIAADVAAIMGGCDIIRVHDVLPCAQAAKMADAIFRGDK